MMKLFFWAVLFFLQRISALYSLADISLIVIDLKYNGKQGVKICELQPGSFSRFSGCDFFGKRNNPDVPPEEINVIPKMYCDLISQYGIPLCFTKPIYQKMEQEFLERGWAMVSSPKKLQSKVIGTVGDPDNISDYEYFFFSVKNDEISPPYRGSFSKILFLDWAVLPYGQDKSLMNQLFDASEETKILRPRWKKYLKGSSNQLVNTILNDIPSDRLVIKPLKSTMGRGVIILDRNDLKGTLKYIFDSNKEILIEDSDRSYSHYAKDGNKFFIVEEFIGSDPIFIPEGGELPYDCTMRVIAVLSYNQHLADITFLAGYWYSPRKPIGGSDSLIECHKAKGAFFSEVNAEIMEEVQNQLRPGLLALYNKMLVY